MSMSLSIGPVVALIAGILILIVPRLLNYIIALYLIVTGLVGLFGSPHVSFRSGLSDVPPASVQQLVPTRPAEVGS